MLSQQENEFLTTTNPGTPMGELFRRYWQPFLLKRELPENDGAPVRVRLLGEDLIAFRDSDGRVGLIGERCPHRGASLYFGINQESGIMCIYHGWKYNVDGKLHRHALRRSGQPLHGKGACHCLPHHRVGWGHLGLHGARGQATAAAHLLHEHAAGRERGGHADAHLLQLPAEH